MGYEPNQPMDIELDLPIDDKLNLHNDVDQLSNEADTEGKATLVPYVMTTQCKATQIQILIYSAIQISGTFAQIPSATSIPMVDDQVPSNSVRRPNV